jgi:hypothetical protein
MMKNSIVRFVQLLMLIVLFAVSAFVSYHYWFVFDQFGLRDLPTLIWSSLIIYILIQLIKRMITKKMEWYDYSYYIALIVILLPFIVPGNPEWMLSLTRYGVLFLLLSPLAELFKFSRKRG